MHHQEAPDFYDRNPELADLLADSISPGERELLPKGWSILGKVIIVKIDPQIESLKARIGEALLEIYPRCSYVPMDRGFAGRRTGAGQGADPQVGQIRFPQPSP